MEELKAIIELKNKEIKKLKKLSLNKCKIIKIAIFFKKRKKLTFVN